MREDGALRIPAILARAGLGERYLNASWPDDVAILDALAVEIDDLEYDRDKRLASLIANEVVSRIK